VARRSIGAAVHYRAPRGLYRLHVPHATGESSQTNDGRYAITFPVISAALIGMPTGWLPPMSSGMSRLSPIRRGSRWIAIGDLQDYSGRDWICGPAVLKKFYILRERRGVIAALSISILLPDSFDGPRLSRRYAADRRGFR